MTSFGWAFIVVKGMAIVIKIAIVIVIFKAIGSNNNEEHSFKTGLVFILHLRNPELTDPTVCLESKS